MSLPPITPESTTPKERGAKPFMERREKILAAWIELAREARFADLTVSEFQALTAPSEETRKSLNQARARICSDSGRQTQRAAALNAVLKRVAHGVRVDVNHGEDSLLYRAMGFVPASERRSRRPGVFSAAGGVQSPGRAKRPRLWNRYQTILGAWEKAEGVLLPGVTVEELREAGAAYAQGRENLAREHTELSRLVGLRHQSDAITREFLRRVVGSVIGNKAYGINSRLYRAMGYIPLVERKRPTRTAPVTPVTG